MYDPFVEDRELTAFLSRHVGVVEAPKSIIDRKGFWTGKRLYHVQLREDKNVEGGYVHPPAYFALGTSRDYLYYRDQPIFCRSCYGFGHLEKDCGAKECTRCGSKDHARKYCRAKYCSVCGEEDHLYKNCRWQDPEFVAASEAWFAQAVEAEDEGEENSNKDRGKSLPKRHRSVTEEKSIAEGKKLKARDGTPVTRDEEENAEEGGDRLGETGMGLVEEGGRGGGRYGRILTSRAAGEGSRPLFTPFGVEP
ncbi:ZCHC3 protein, partial [Atractosteus spatula]|nr:ZCHC3 protein [Atractosteus spatula]